jgi:hypothetical protein
MSSLVEGGANLNRGLTVFAERDPLIGRNASVDLDKVERNEAGPRVGLVQGGGVLKAGVRLAEPDPVRSRWRRFEPSPSEWTGVDVTAVLEGAETFGFPRIQIDAFARFSPPSSR